MSWRDSERDNLDRRRPSMSPLSDRQMAARWPVLHLDDTECLEAWRQGMSIHRGRNGICDSGARCQRSTGVEVSLSPQREKKTSYTTHSAPNSHVCSSATFQHRSCSSRTLPNLRPLFAPLCAFFCSLVNFVREGPPTALPEFGPGTPSASVSGSPPETPPSAASSSGIGPGSSDTKYLLDDQLLCAGRVP